MCGFAFGNMQSPEGSMYVKGAINKPIRGIVETSRLARSTIWYTVKEKQCTGDHSYSKRPGTTCKATAVDAFKILSMVKKNPS